MHRYKLTFLLDVWIQINIGLDHFSTTIGRIDYGLQWNFVEEGPYKTFTMVSVTLTSVLVTVSCCMHVCMCACVL